MRESVTSHSEVATTGAPRVLIASTAMLAFISFWQAAAVVLNDMGSSAFYAGAIAEHFIGKTAPWFILAIMVLAYAVRAVYIESCSMFVRGGVYRVVKEALGGTLAKISVSALMFDYILTGPISSVSAGQYVMGWALDALALADNAYQLLNAEQRAYLTSQRNFITSWGAVIIAIAITVYFYRRNVIGLHESSEK